MIKVFSVKDFRENYKTNMYHDEPWNNIKLISIYGMFKEEDIDDTKNNSEFYGKIASTDYPGGIAIGSSIKDIVPNTEKLYGKKIIIYGLTSESYIGLFNLYTITKVEVLNENDKVVETYDSNEKSKTNLRQYFNQMNFTIPKEFREK